MKTVYLDHNATTPVDPLVVEAMLPYLRTKFGNASSVHSFGRDAKVALENAREQIAAVINCDPSELYFTSGGTESDNIAVLGTVIRYRDKKNRVVVGAAEHHAVLEPAEYLAHGGSYKLDLLPVDHEGFSSADKLRELITDKTAIVSVMHANNETGTIQDIKALANVAHEKDCLFHSDAVQSTGKVAVDVRQLDVDMASITAHKIYGPKGIGALYIRSGIKVSPLFYGGSHEKKRRPGTENVAGAVGFAKALEIALVRQEQDYKSMSELADYFIDKVIASIPDVSLNGSRTNRVPQTMNISFRGVEGESIVLAMDLKGVACSSGSACTSGTTEPSHVLKAMGVENIMAQGAIRFSIGRSTTRDDLDYVLGVLPGVIEKLREMSPVYSRK